MKIPIVLTAFGTTTAAVETYTRIREEVAKAFPGHPVELAYSSRMVRNRLVLRDKGQAPDPFQALEKLYRQGHKWAVVQSLHLICGHEFYRLVNDTGSLSIRTSLGLPLLTSYQDHLRLARALARDLDVSPGSAVVLVGHGTDHPAWTTYPAFETIIRRQAGGHFHVGILEGLPDRQETISQVLESGATKVLLVPFMLVAGIHFRQDLLEGGDSWKSAFQKAGLEVNLVHRGLGQNPSVVEIFCDHVRQAMDSIPHPAT